MPEFILQARSAFGGVAPISDTWPGFSIAEDGTMALASLTARRGAAATLREAMRARFGVDLPQPGRWVSGSPVGFIWMGYEQWFAESPLKEIPDLPGELQNAAGDSASITDQGDAWARLRISGPRTREVLMRLSPLDHDPGAFPVGAVARTMMEHIAAIILAIDEAPTYVLLTPRSSARSFLANLRHAALGALGPP